MGFKYSDSGVDIDMEGEAIKSLVKGMRARKGFGAPLMIGKGFAGLIDFGEYALSLCTDGVGSKILIAEAMAKYDTIGIDCIAMNVNDMICIGAEPLAFVDYLAIDRPDPKITREVGKGLSKGARLSNISIIGGETASLPDIVKGLDLAGTCLGHVKKKDIIDGSKVRPGDAIVGIKSAGVHSNGFSLVRRIVKKKGLDYKRTYPGLRKNLGSELLSPTRIYVKEILAVLKRFKIKGMAHITGGGLRNLNRINADHGYEITDPFRPQPIFDLIASMGVEEKEMYQTFNMGLGFVMVIARKHAKALASTLGKNAKVIGQVVKGGGVSQGDIHFDRY